MDDAVKEQDEVKEVVTAVTAYHEATRHVRTEREGDFKFNLGGVHQWETADVEKLKAEKRPILTFNFSGAVINFVAGYQQEREQDYRCYPRGTEDEHVGRISTALMKYQQDIARGPHTFHKGFRQGLIGGQSVFEVSHSYDLTDDLLEGDVTLDVLEHDTWGHEPGARRYDRNDASYQFKLMWMTLDEAQRKWPSKAAMLKAGVSRDWLKEDPALTGVPLHLVNHFVDKATNRIRIMQYWYRVPVEVALLVNTQTGEIQRFESQKKADDALRTIFDTAGAQAASQYKLTTANSQSALIHNSGQIFTFQKPEQAEQLLTDIHAQAGAQAAQGFEIVTRPTTALKVKHLTAWQILDDKPSPKGSDWRYPFVPFTVYQDTDDLNHIKGMIRDIKDPQREINWHHSTTLDVLVRGPKGGVWVSKGENTDINKLRAAYAKAGFVGEYAGQPPIPVTPQGISEGDMAMLQFGIDAIMRITGVNAEMLGQTTQKTVSGRAIQSRQAGGLVGIGSIFMNWTETKTLIGQLILRCIQQYYSPEKMDRIIGAEQRKLKTLGMLAPETIPVEKMYELFKTLKQVDMDVVVSYQDASPTARAAVSAQLMQFKAAGAPIPLSLIVEASDVPYKNEINAAIAQQGEQPPNGELAKVVSAGQGQSGPSGVNTSV